MSGLTLPLEQFIKIMRKKKTYMQTHSRVLKFFVHLLQSYQLGVHATLDCMYFCFNYIRLD